MNGAWDEVAVGLAEVGSAVVAWAGEGLRGAEEMPGVTEVLVAGLGAAGQAAEGSEVGGSEGVNCDAEVVVTVAIGLAVSRVAARSISCQQWNSRRRQRRAGRSSFHAVDHPGREQGARVRGKSQRTTRAARCHRPTHILSERDTQRKALPATARRCP